MTLGQRRKGTWEVWRRGREDVAPSDDVEGSPWHERLLSSMSDIGDSPKNEDPAPQIEVFGAGSFRKSKTDKIGDSGKRGISFTVESLEDIPSKVDEESSKELKEGKSWIRYVVLTATIVCLSSIMANIVCFNFTILCMPRTGEVLSGNHTAYEGYTKNERTWLFSAVAVGALLAVVPVAHAISTIGSKKVFFAAGMLTGVATALVPVAATFDLNTFLALRFIQGISFAACMPTVGSVTSSWASLHQQGLFIAVLTTFGQLSSVFSMPVSGQLCTSSLGWQSVYYVHAGISFVSFILWFVVYTDTPDQNKMVKTRELAEINAGKSSSSLVAQNKPTAIPYLEIVTTPSVWGVWVGALGDLVAVQLIHTFSPLYIRQVLQYSVNHTGFAAAVPVLVQFCVKVFAGHSSDKIRGVSETTKLRVFNTVALGFSAVFLAVLGFVQKGQGLLGLSLISLATAMFGFNGGGFNKCATMVSRQYSHFVLANIQFIWCLSMLICPILVSLLLPTGSVAEWRTVFFAHAGLLLVSNAVFCALATAKPAPWTDREIKNPAAKNTPLYHPHHGEEPCDLSLSDNERSARQDFYRAIERMNEARLPVMACVPCLTVFKDVIVFRLHASLHSSQTAWQCALCGGLCRDRRSFQQHVVFNAHDV
ncbi:unnamed protein product [Caenorhabditis auriculariae]|uniref:Major facilitator superfamily (MFS) profile domain-containing protein n=1 Tax=Caenorhabditis auriculariae TaxID=2777116 RepID=A0A8S1HJV2_9PELO|nr:unnamed protein product [Caenorhabditis auriculariae]